MEQVATYFADEMNRNITHPALLKMKKLKSFDAAAENAKFQLPPRERCGCDAPLD